jgi:hypothetical protein
LTPSDRRTILPLVILTILLTPGARAQDGLSGDSVIARRLGMFAPAILTADTTHLAAGDRLALRDLIAAGKAVDDLYLRQSWPGSRALLDSLAADSSAGGRLRYRYFMVNMSPWSVVDRSRAFLPGVPDVRPPRADFYPEGMKRSDWGPWFIQLDAGRQAEADGPVYVVRWDSAGRMKTVPYSEEYASYLAKISGPLTKAASESGDAATAAHLRALTAAFLSNDYRKSQGTGVAADGALSVTLGPTSSTLDELFHYKMAFECVVGVRNEEATRWMKTMEQSLGAIGKALDPRLSHRAAGGKVYLRIDDAAYVGGAARAGAVASTLRLPADSTLVPETGKKTILLRNVHERKFGLIQVPIAAAMIDSAQLGAVSFDAYFLHLMMHELSHRFAAPSTGGATPPEPQLSSLVDIAPAFEEAKADLAGLEGVEYLAAKGILPRSLSQSVYITHFSGLLRALRFWRNDPFVVAAAIQFNFHREHGALKYDPTTGLFHVNVEKMKASVRRLYDRISQLQAGGDTPESDAFYQKYSPLPPELKSLPERLAGIPYDLEPTFPLAD